MRFELSLEQLCLVKVASCVWNKKATRKQFQTKLYFNTVALQNENQIVNEEDANLDILLSIPQLRLPKPLHAKLVEMCIFLGNNIINWSGQMKENNFELIVSCYQLTSVGTVDNRATITQFFKSRTNLVVLFYFACHCCYEDLIDVLWPHASEHLDQDEFIFTSDDRILLAYWVARLRNKDLKSFLHGLGPTSYRFELVTGDVEEYILKICAKNGWSLGFKYFWERLNHYRRSILLSSLFSLVMSKAMESCKTKYIEILYLLYPIVMEDGTEKNETIFMTMFACFWPYAVVTQEKFKNFRGCWSEEQLQQVTSAFLPFGYELMSGTSVFRIIFDKVSSETRVNLAKHICDILPFRPVDTKNICLMMRQFDLEERKEICLFLFHKITSESVPPNSPKWRQFFIVCSDALHMNRKQVIEMFKA